MQTQGDSFTLLKMGKEEKKQLESVSCFHKMSSLSVIRCFGEDIRTYLQGQITQDIALLHANQQGIYTMILTPKGKCVSEAWLIESDKNQIDMIVPTMCTEALVQRLRMFSLGYQLKMGVLTDKEILAITNPYQGSETLYDIDSQDGGIHLPHARFVIHQKDMPYPDLAEINDETMQAWEVLHGVPRQGLDWSESVYPLNAGLIQRQGISFEKGCYVGQEVASRMHWRQLIKTKFYQEKLKSFDVDHFEGRTVLDESSNAYFCLRLMNLMEDCDDGFVEILF
ncbi:MAG: hypothetical protein Q9M28_07910 [Mariprofundaceae bacterium]|nr:hypothetical protein [Mariprofundaceae bacterium]